MKKPKPVRKCDQCGFEGTSYSVQGSPKEPKHQYVQCSNCRKKIDKILSKKPTR